MTEQKQVIPEGYKQTEVGVIPTDWDLIYIEECTTKVGSGKTPTGGSSVYSNHGRPFIRSQNVDWGKLELSDVAYISDEIHCTFLGSELKENDVLLNITGASIGRCAIADQRIAGGNVNQHVCIIRTEPKKFNPNLLVEFINSSFGQKQIDSYQAGGNREGLNFSQVKQLKFAIPKTLKEQTAIANALSDVDALISELEKLIAKKQAIKTATMQQLLTGKTRLPEFALREDGTPKGYKSSELGEIPEDWEVVLLSSLCDIKDGTHDSPKYKDSGVPLVTSKNIVGDILDMSDVSLISEFDAFEINKRSKVDKGDIIMSMIGTVGSAVLVVNEPNFCIKNIALFKPKKLSGEYLIQLIKSKEFQGYLQDSLDGGIQKFVSLGTLRNLEIIVPSAREQTSIATILSDMDDEIQTLQQRLNKTRQIKQGMMQALLTGKTRLI